MGLFGVGVAAALAVALPEKIDILLIEKGEMAEVHVVVSHLRARSRSGSFERDLRKEERERLGSAAMRAMAATELRRGCGKGEVYVSLTVDGKTAATAVCPQSSEELFGPWKVLIATVRAVAVR